MKKIFKNIKADRGEIVLFVVFVILFFMLFIGLFISQMILREIRMANNTADSVQSYYAADSGTEIVLYRIQKQTAPPFLSGTYPQYVGDANNPIYPGDNDYSIGGTDEGRDFGVTIKQDPSTSRLIIDVLGTYKQTSRAIELSWDNT